MKILVYFSGNVTEPKGTPIRVKNILIHLIKNRADVYYASRIMPEKISLASTVFLAKPYARPWQLAKFIRQNKIDIFYIVTSAGIWLAPFLRILTRAKIGCDMHSLRVEEEKVYKNLSIVSYMFQKYTEYFLCLFLHFATGCSVPLGQYYKRFIGTYHLFPVGVDLSLFNRDVVPDKELLLWKGNALLIGYAGNTKWYQGLDLVLSALAKLNEEKRGMFKLVIVASSLDPSVGEFIEKNNLSEAVFVLGKQPHEKVPSLLMAADILTIVRPSDMITEYAFPSKFPEHAALGKALIVSKVGDLHRYVEDGVSALIVEPQNVEELANALLKLTDPKLREKLGEGAARLAQERFDINAIGKKMYDFLFSQSKL